MTWEVITGDCLEVMAGMEPGSIDAVITDPPYSERVHRAHNKAVRDSDRRSIPYNWWTAETVAAFVCAIVRVSRGWLVALSDSNLVSDYDSAFAGCGLITFQPVPCVISGMAVRLAGDGPSSWAVYANVARPRALYRWGTLPGAYTGPRERQPHIGGKPIWLMRSLIADYTRPGDTVIDPCCGSGTTGAVCVEMGRNFIGIEIDPTYADIARERIDTVTRQGRLDLAPAPKPEQGGLF